MITGNTINLRAIELNDIDLLYKWENDTSIWKISQTIEPFSRVAIEQYVTSIRDIYADKQLRLIISLSSDQTSVGCVDLFDFDPNNQRAGVGILIADAKDRGKGYASEALGLLIEYAFTTLNLHQLYCNVPVNNESSLKLFKNQGFITIGIKKDWIRNGSDWNDEYILQLIN